ncbi:DUF4112 domain-containing protein [Algihabitans albus]|uniref:DUF4112 domain-containing protein n=1 Tax=Algihabitans albus TaxID=2164067 RepID=UPI002286DA97|nr:DUF4112 domain-containing protein [Algihabitans albus]
MRLPREKEPDQTERLARLADWMDSRFRIPGTNIRFGLDAIVGLVPGIGDGVSLIPAAYIVGQAARLGIPKTVLVRMIFNIALDSLLGSIPLIGDLFDVGFKANRNNIDLLRRSLADASYTNATEKAENRSPSCDSLS